MADISVSLGLNNTQFNQALNQSTTQVDQFASHTDQQTKLLAAAFGALAGAVAAIGIGELVKTAGTLATEIVKLSNATGISVQSVKGWQDALVNAGGEADNTRDALADLNNKISEAAQGGGSLLTAFNQVGVSLADLQSKGQQDIMQQVVKGLADTKDGATRTSLAMQLMGEDVKTVDFRKVADDLQTFTDRAARVAPSMIDARNAQVEFNKAYQVLLDEITIAIPWDTIASGIKSIADNADSIIALTKSLAELAAIFLAIQKILIPLEALLISVATGATTIAVACAPLTRILGAFLTATVTWFKELKSLAEIAALAFFGLNASVQSLSTGFLALFAILLRFGVVLSVLYAINDASKLLFSNGSSLWDWAQQQAKAIGLISETGKEEDARKARMKAASEDALKAMDEENAGRQRQSAFLQQSIKGMNDLVASYRDHNNEILKGINNDTAQIGLGQDQVKLQQTKNQLQNDYLAKVEEINQKIAEGGDPTIVDTYRKALDGVTAAYKEQSGQIESAIKAQIEKERADRSNTYAQNELAAAMQRINDLNHESANMFLPLIEQKYKDIEYAAQSSINAQLKAEALARGVKVEQLPADTVATITAAGNAKVEAEKASVAQNERLVELKNLENFRTDAIVESSKQLQDIYNDMATSTMPELQAMQTKISQDAMSKAKAEIAAENARRGSKMSAEEERKYYEAAVSGTRELIKATEESYNQSREWSTGWTKAMNSYITDATNGAKQAEQIFTKAIGGMEDALVNFAKTGKFEWKGFLSSLLEELLRTQIQAVFAGMIGDMTGALKGSASGSKSSSILGGIGDLIGLGGSDAGKSSGSDAGFLSTALGFGKEIVSGAGDFFGEIGSGISDLFSGGIGDIFGGIGDFFGGFFASGGTLGAGNWGIAGENGPEIISGPATITPLNNIAAPSNTNITYNINAVDAMSFKQMIAADPTFLYGVVAQGAKGISRR